MLLFIITVLRRLSSPASVIEVELHQLLHQLVAVDLADQAARVIVVGDVRRVLGEEIAYDLVDRVLTLLLQRVIYCGQRALHLLVGLVYKAEFSCAVKHVCLLSDPTGWFLL